MAGLKLTDWHEQEGFLSFTNEQGVCEGSVMDLTALIPAPSLDTVDEDGSWIPCYMY